MAEKTASARNIPLKHEQNASMVFASYWGLGDQLMATDLVLEVGKRLKDET